MKQGVGVIITNEEKGLFYIQQKDETYPLKEFRLKYTVFGGGIEEGEDDLEALERELLEELDGSVAKIVFASSKKIKGEKIKTIHGEEYLFNLYESTLSNEEIKEISKHKVKEGKQGSLISKNDISKIEFVDDLIPLLEEYFTGLTNQQELN